MWMRTFIGFVIGAAVLAFAGPAFAVSSTSYGSKAHPVKAEAGSDDGNAWFYGTAKVHQHTHLRNSYQFRDSARGGNAAYVETEWAYWVTCIDGSACWDESGGDQSKRDKSGKWKSGVDYDLLDSTADRGRANARVCEDQAHAIDDCSRWVVNTLSY